MHMPSRDKQEIGRIDGASRRISSAKCGIALTVRAREIRTFGIPLINQNGRQVQCGAGVHKRPIPVPRTGPGPAVGRTPDVRVVLGAVVPQRSLNGRAGDVCDDSAAPVVERVVEAACEYEITSSNASMR